MEDCSDCRNYLAETGRCRRGLDPESCEEWDPEWLPTEKEAREAASVVAEEIDLLPDDEVFPDDAAFLDDEPFPDEDDDDEDSAN